MTGDGLDDPNDDDDEDDDSDFDIDETDLESYSTVLESNQDIDEFQIFCESLQSKVQEKQKRTTTFSSSLIIMNESSIESSNKF